MGTFVEKLRRTIRGRRLFQREEIAISFTEMATKIVESKRTLKRSARWKRLLEALEADPDHDFTLTEMSDLMFSLGHSLEFVPVPHAEV